MYRSIGRCWVPAPLADSDDTDATDGLVSTSMTARGGFVGGRRTTPTWCSRSSCGVDYLSNDFLFRERRHFIAVYSQQLSPAF